MPLPISTAAFCLALAVSVLPLGAAAASCDVPGPCDLVREDGHWIATDDRDRTIDLHEPASATNGVVVTDGAREHSGDVVDGSRTDAVFRIYDSVMWTHSSDGQDEQWARAPRAPSGRGGHRGR